MPLLSRFCWSQKSSENIKVKISFSLLRNYQNCTVIFLGSISSPLVYLVLRQFLYFFIPSFMKKDLSLEVRYPLTTQGYAFQPFCLKKYDLLAKICCTR